ncbi:hypothetical protein SAFG77S_11865 [Streptomyces afghaniensis]
MEERTSICGTTPTRCTTSTARRRSVTSSPRTATAPPGPLGSTSKITSPGQGSPLSPANVAWWRANSGEADDRPDKVNQLHHALFLKDTDGLRAHAPSPGAQVRGRGPRLQRAARRHQGWPRFPAEGPLFVALDGPSGGPPGRRGRHRPSPPAALHPTAATIRMTV